MLIEPLDEERREQFAFLDEPEFVVGDRCKRCGGPVVAWDETVYCCELCTGDTLHCFACDSCRIMSDTFL